MTPELKKETDRKLQNYHQLNQSAKKGQILFAGSSLMEMFPIEEFLQEMGSDIVIYNRGVGGYKTEDMLNAMDICVYELAPSRIFINIGNNYRKIVMLSTIFMTNCINLLCNYSYRLLCVNF